MKRTSRSRVVEFSVIIVCIIIRINYNQENITYIEIATKYIL